MSDAKAIAWPLGPLEERIMGAIWRRGSATVRQVLDELIPGHRVAYTTVMTVMARLAEKGLLRRSAQGNTYLYTAVFSEDQYAALVTQRVTRDLVDRFGPLALAQFAAELERVDPEALQQLHRLAAEEEGP